ncbi:J-type co-chaperone JAC1, mitochondrial [Daldinia childiae]|uniref:J-type co-chaperone JAC1, mitochondrial n=1 Tax=Daldinia childiae TaxID=326645 RepID=UPI00144844F2|nr:J-type co-chaperone JAC1, mitochondrial [Daldinia childiae]KAF3059429.1 J-type co-chaperone JAC1, mitochondrial [Daldinia childiae]
MRSSLLPRRPLRRVCDACRQQQSLHATSTIINRNPSSRQLTTIRPTPCRTHISNSNNSNTLNLQTRRHLSSSASSSPREQEASATEQEPLKPASTELQDGKKPISHYDLFPQTLPQGPPPKGRFAIDVRALRREFLTLQATAHPDLAPAGASSKRRAEAASAYINEAYRTLADPLARAQYLLRQRWGIDAAGEEAGRVEDPELLMLVLETREAIEEAECEEDLEPLRVQNEARIRESEDRLARAFEEEEGEGDDGGERARREVTRLRYWVNIKDAVSNWEEGKPVVLQH